MNNMFTNYFYEGKPTHIGTIMFEISKVNFDSYKRSYSRLQSLLAEVMSVINLLFGIGKTVTEILLKRKMSKDIVKYFISKNLMYKISSENEKINHNQNYQNKEDSEIELTHPKKNSENMTIKNETKNFSEYRTETNINQDKIEDINYFDTINRLNYYNIFLSYLCCENSNTKLIKLCDDLVDEDLCLENILSRIYELENEMNILFKIEQINYKVNENEKFKEISKCIYEIEKKRLNKKE